MAAKIKTPRTMTHEEFLADMIETVKELTRDLTEVADRVEELLGPAPRPDLSLVPENEDA